MYSLSLASRCMAAAFRLFVKNQQHELIIRYFDEVDLGTFSEAFLERFGRPGLSQEERFSEAAKAYALDKYAEALEAACEDPEQDIVITHGPPPLIFHCEQPTGYLQ